MCAPDVKTARDELVDAARKMGAAEWWNDPDMDKYPEEWLRLAWAIRAYDLARSD